MVRRRAVRLFQIQKMTLHYPKQAPTVRTAPVTTFQIQIHARPTINNSRNISPNDSFVPKPKKRIHHTYIQAFPPHELNVCTNLNFPPSTLKS
jgi:hypothetical protein